MGCPQSAVHKNWECGRSVWSNHVLFSGISNTFGRIVSGVVSDLPRMSALLVNNVCLIVAGVATMLCPYCDDYTAMIVYAAVFGFFLGKYTRHAWTCLYGVLCILFFFLIIQPDACLSYIQSYNELEMEWKWITFKKWNWNWCAHKTLLLHMKHYCCALAVVENTPQAEVTLFSCVYASVIEPERAVTRRTLNRGRSCQRLKP